MINDPGVRKYYRQDLDARVATLFAPSVRGSDRGFPGKEGRFGVGRWGKERWQKGRPGAQPLAAPSARLATSQIVRGARSALSSREALILLAVVNHPWLLETHAEDLAELEFRHGDGDRLRRAILDATAGRLGVRGGALRSADATRRVARGVEATITHPSDWPAREGAAERMSVSGTHVVSLHRKSRTLHKELKDAELALGTEPSEENPRLVARHSGAPCGARGAGGSDRRLWRSVRPGSADVLIPRSRKSGNKGHVQAQSREPERERLRT